MKKRHNEWTSKAVIKLRVMGILFDSVVHRSLRKYKIKIPASHLRMLKATFEHKC